MNDPKQRYSKKILSFKTVLFFAGAFLVLSGILLINLSFKHESLDKNYSLKEVTEYPQASKPQLKPGELSVIKSTNYKEKGIYEIKYTNYSKKSEYSLLEKGTTFNITDIIGQGFKVKPNIVINNKSYTLENNKLKTKDNIEVLYVNNVLDIQIPSNLIENNNVIQIELELTSRQINKRYVTSEDAYYSFIPSYLNDNYPKKATQSYVIDGYGYIELDKK